MTRVFTKSVHSLWRRIALRRGDVLGREQGQAIVRVAVSSVVLIWLAVHFSPIDFSDGLPHWLIFMLGFLVVSAGIAALALRDKLSRLVRRVAANAADVTAITYLMSSTGEAGAPLFVLYLWITLGNGFRFGLAAMAISTVLSLSGFAIVMATSALWQQHVMLAAAVMVALLVLPFYAAHLIHQLHRARERAEEASVAKGKFLARMSHELRTPLNGIQGTTDLLRNSRRLTTEERELLGVIQESVAVSLRQIDSVLDFARIEAGKLVLEQAEFDLYRLLHASARMVSPAAREKRLRLLVRITPETPFRLTGDAHYLREILLNLLSNAVKFTHTGYVALQVEPIAVTADSVRLRFEIRDTGIGIAPEALERIWEGFAQEDTSTTRRYGGTGLGTTIAKQLAELMGGRIAVSSIKGRGTVFWCELPFGRPAGAEGADAIVPAARLLLLSGDRERVEHLAGLVKGMQGTLAVAASVPEAISVLGRGIRLGNPWHLVLVDDRLAVTAGQRHLAGELVDKALTAQTPAYLLSDVPRDVERLCEWGYAAVLSSRPTPAILASAIHASPHYDAEAVAPAGVVRVEPWAWGAANRAKRRVLVADDIRTNRLILQQMLAVAGYEADAVDDGEQALDRLSAGGYKAAILDLHMPGFDGVDLLRRYRLLAGKNRVPVIMLTADVTFDAKSDCAEAGADAFLTKPVSADTLLATLDRLVQEREVHELPASPEQTGPEPGDGEAPVLDVSVLSELDRICRDPVRLAAVVEIFESESESLLARATESVQARSYPSFVEAVHALKGNAANVGAVQLAAACQRAQVAGVLEFRRDGAGMVRELRKYYATAREALRELAPSTRTPEKSGPG